MMRRIVAPRQNRLFDPYDRILNEATRGRLLDSWPGVFRQRYRRRNEIEEANSVPKHRTGPDHLRVRGRPEEE